MSKDKETRSEVRDDDRKTLGERLREAREYLGFSQEEVAAFLGVSRSALSNMETGQRKVEALELKKLAGLYKRSVSYFTGEEAEGLTFEADVAHLARKASELSADDRAELGRFADFLRARKQTKGG
jgi:transcriptional regulator with XRE-family HTH domain